jgi:translation elongation factor P/translation initiation factor 5A
MHVKPGKGGAFNQVEMKNLIDGTKLNERFRSSETVERIRLEQKDFQFLYEQGEACWCSWIWKAMSSSSCRRILSATAAAFLQDGMMVTVELHDERPIGIALPDHVTLADCRGRSRRQGSDRGVVLQAGDRSKTVCAFWCRRSSPPGNALSSTPMS